jgi:hypothetical protein
MNSEGAAPSGFCNGRDAVTIADYFAIAVLVALIIRAAARVYLESRL